MYKPNLGPFTGAFIVGGGAAALYFGGSMYAGYHLSHEEAVKDQARLVRQAEGLDRCAANLGKIAGKTVTLPELSDGMRQDCGINTSIAKYVSSGADKVYTYPLSNGTDGNITVTGSSMKSDAFNRSITVQMPTTENVQKAAANTWNMANNYNYTPHDVFGVLAGLAVSAAAASYFSRLSEVV